tara:strand:+ start:928 stop:1116 length:189 start_codon:yes stop_codon:yes gene_type:complete
MKEVNDENQSALRQKGLIGENEVAYVKGDLLVVINVLNEDRRVLGRAVNFINENVNRTILKG